MLVEMPAYAVISRLDTGEDQEAISTWLTGAYDLPIEEARRFVTEIAGMLANLSDPAKEGFGSLPTGFDTALPAIFYSMRRYLINGVVYSCEYETPHLEQLIHPKFAHLEAAGDLAASHFFQLFHSGGKSLLKVNGIVIGQWLPEDDHYLSGKFSMELLNRIYEKGDSDWMGVFHASAISRGNQCLLFLGDSGSGKSTICAVLMAAGFNLVADDFVPVSGLKGEVFHFPAAVSVKKNAIAPLLHLFPGLSLSVEHSVPGQDKQVRYLPVEDRAQNYHSGYLPGGLIFVRYKRNSRLKLEKLAQDIAFQKLVPDSWISPLGENAAHFLDWFLALPCYQLTYSDNEQMVKTIDQFFEYEEGVRAPLKVGP